MNTKYDEIILSKENINFWKLLEFDHYKLIFRGHAYNISILLKKLKDTSNISDDEMCKLLTNLSGHFALFIIHRDYIIASVDRVQSISLHYTDVETFLMSDSPKNIIEKWENSKLEIDIVTAKILSMSGFGMGNSTLLKKLKILPPGSYLKYNKIEKTVLLKQYYLYIPTPVRRGNRDDETNYYHQQHESVLISIFQKLIKSLDGREVLVPLSAGLDSRLVISALHHLGYKNIKAYSYGLPGNFESKMSKQIAEKLNVDWFFIPITHRTAKDIFFSSEHREYFNSKDSYTFLTSEHEFIPTYILKKQKKISDDAIIINGMSGDFISGSHIPKLLWPENLKNTIEERKMAILTGIIQKHYSLWDSLKTPVNLDFISKMLWEEIELYCPPINEHESKNDFSKYEFSEWRNRQSKYVVGVQKVYDFFHYDWRLPLWDGEYMDFWKEVPLELKIQRNFFVASVNKLNWGNVWNQVEPKRYLSPKYIAAIRNLAKLAFIASPRQKWENFDKRVFSYWTEILCKGKCVGYWEYLFDKRGYRHSASWLTETYLKHHGLQYDGSPIEKD